MKEVTEMMGIQQNLSTAYHPQTDGQTERVNQEIEQYLQIYINHRQEDWAEWLPVAEFSYNDKIHTATGYSVFQLTEEHHLWKGTEPYCMTSNVLRATKFIETLSKI